MQRVTRGDDRQWHWARVDQHFTTHTHELAAHADPVSGSTGAAAYIVACLRTVLVSCGHCQRTSPPILCIAEIPSKRKKDKANVNFESVIHV